MDLPGAGAAGLHIAWILRRALADGTTLPRKGLAKSGFVIYQSIMNSATTADLRNHFRRVSAWLDNGESVEILKRGKPYATLLPIAKTAKPHSPRVDFRAQCQAIWQDRTLSAAEVAEMRDSELEGEE
jgi:hypothetical protein